MGYRGHSWSCKLTKKEKKRQPKGGPGEKLLEQKMQRPRGWANLPGPGGMKRGNSQTSEAGGTGTEQELRQEVCRQRVQITGGANGTREVLLTPLHPLPPPPPSHHGH